MDHPHRLRQVQRAAGPGGSHFADAVTDYRRRDCSQLAQHLGEPDLDGEQQRLRHLGELQSLRLVRKPQRLLDGKLPDLEEQRIDRADRLAEGLGLLQQVTRHTRPLRTVAGIDEHRTGGTAQRLSTGQPAARLALGMTPQGGDQLGAIIGESDGTVSMQVAVEGGTVGDVVQAVRRLFADAAGQGRGRCPHRCLGAARNHQRGQGRPGGGGLHCARQVVAALQHHVGIGAAEAEGVDADGQFPGRVQRGVLGRHPQVPVIEANVRVGGLQMDGGRHRAVPQTQDGFGHGIANGGAGAVGLHVIQFGRVDSGPSIDLAQQFRLGFGPRYGDAVGAPVAVHPAACHHGENAVAILERLRQWFEQEQPTALGTHIAVTGGVEHVADAARREHRGTRKTDERVRVQMQ